MNFPSFTVLIAAAGLVAGFVLCWLVMRGRGTAPTPAVHETQGALAQAKGRIRQLEGERLLAVKNYEDLKHETARERSMHSAVKKDDAPLAGHATQVTALQAQLAALHAQEQAQRVDAAKVKSETLAEQAQAKEYFRLLEKNQQLAAVTAQALKLEADRLREALDAGREEQVRATQQAAQVPVLQAQLAATRSQDQSRQQAMLRGAQGQAETGESLKRAQARVLALEQENIALKRSTSSLPGSLTQPAAALVQATQLPVLEEQVAALQDLEKAIRKEFQLLAELQRSVTLTTATRYEFNDSPESRTGCSAAA